MKLHISRITLVVIAAALTFGNINPSRAVDDGRGKDWSVLGSSPLFEDPGATPFMTWSQVAALCPRDGATPCSGALAGWVWATREQVREVYGIYAPDIMTSPTDSVSGAAYGSPAGSFFNWMNLQFWQLVCIYGGCAPLSNPLPWISEGWTASTDAYGNPYKGVVTQFSTTGGNNPNAGSFALVAATNPNAVLPPYLWRSTAVGGIIAHPDAGRITSYSGGAAIVNVLANDFVNGAGATTANVQLTLISSGSTGVTLNPATSAVNVAAATPSGTHSLVYQICDVANPTRCAQGTATVTVAYAIVARNDQGTASPSTGGVAVANVLANDTFAGGVATLAQVQLSQVSSSDPGISLDIASGRVNVAAGTPLGAQSLSYRICEIAAPANCATANVAVTVKYLAIVANNDQGSASPATGGVAVANVLANDTLAGTAATLARVQLSQVSSSNPGVSLDIATGRVNVAAGTPLGAQSLSYRICEIAAPANCATATVAVTVKHNAIVANNDYVRASSKTAATILNVLTNDRFMGGPATVGNVTLTQVSITPNTADIRLNLSTGGVQVLRKTSSSTYALVYKICETNAPTNCSQATATLELSGK